MHMLCHKVLENISFKDTRSPLNSNFKSTRDAQVLWLISKNAAVSRTDTENIVA
jgi:hypothetical protein